MDFQHLTTVFHLFYLDVWSFLLDWVDDQMNILILFNLVLPCVLEHLSFKLFSALSPRTTAHKLQLRLAKHHLSRLNLRGKNFLLQCRNQRALCRSNHLNLLRRMPQMLLLLRLYHLFIRLQIIWHSLNLAKRALLTRAATGRATANSPQQQIEIIFLLQIQLMLILQVI